MTYELHIGDRTFSSWSLRGWLMLEKFGLPCSIHMTGLYAGTFTEDMTQLAPARLVPVLRTPEGDLIGESMAIAETLAERHPQAQHWPGDARLRARARWLCAEMASGFSALRSTCPMQLSHVNGGFMALGALLEDVERVETLWNNAWEMTGSNEGWLFGSYSLADVFYTPVAARIIGYDLSVSEEARAYCLRLLSDPVVTAWRAEGLKTTYDPFPYPTFEPI
jgi:glutathione S-transferase